MMWGYGVGGWPAMIMMTVFGFLWLVLIGVAIWALVRWVSRDMTSQGPAGPTPTGRESSAMETLRQRYARGEIDAATFEDMRARLEATRTAPPATTSRPDEPLPA